VRSHRHCAAAALLIAAAAVLLPLSAGASPRQGLHVSAELVAERSGIQPGAALIVAVRLVAEPGWHVYWKNPGDSGLPTAVKWELPPGYTVGPLQWPAPSRFPLSGEVTYGYSGETLLMAEVTPPADLPAGGAALISASVSWLACKVECVPGDARLSLSLPVRLGPAPEDGRWRAAFRAARALLPVQDPTVRVSAAASGKSILLTVRGAPAPADAYFFTERDGLSASSAPQVLEASAGGFSLSILRADPAAPLPALMEGVLVLAGSAASGDGFSRGSPGGASSRLRALSISTALDRGGASAGGSSTSASLPLALAVLFAFLGGLILNLMPCVLPVLSLKVLGFVREAHDAPRRALGHGMVFTAGVIVSFWVLLGALLALRAGGNLLGWGFQFQDPGVIMVMAILVFVLGLNMFGLFELGARAAGVGAGLRSRRGLAGSFFTGVLATLVATPCTAPFMGSALGFALTQPPASAFLVFSALGVGMAAPSLVLSASPRLLARVPKPGPWMDTLKQALGFLMVATVVWLGSVLAALAGAGALTALLAALAAAALGAWIYGRWGGLQRVTGARVAAAVLGAVLVVGAAAFGVASVRAPSPGARASASGAPARGDAASPEWEPFTPARLAELRAGGQPVIIDFGAEWCLTCKVNERIALANPAVRQRLSELGVARLRADWTDRNDTIAHALVGYGRSGVPLYVVYGPGSAEPVLLPEIITPGIVLAALSWKPGQAGLSGVEPRPGSGAAPVAAPAVSDIEKAFSP
jgi:thiol:disulfide interchange protein/DsbC/DsbD-like thiol-disulfide interchange protein